ncbi:e3 ubiquitin-protein ligase [Gigaspora margarita]|uniref:E3 ubiquitin-protein ligase n=1 Tax=Gigaspora margarita TaxID=4874 RepID=A0A8H4ARP8_GIGMA|nr:e3 ubiquitin-protein ligase [Gigaspora margarita]
MKKRNESKTYNTSENENYRSNGGYDQNENYQSNSGHQRNENYHSNSRQYRNENYRSNGGSYRYENYQSNSGDYQYENHRDQFNDENINIDPSLPITSIFHVYLPANVDTLQPAVVGNCRTLGNWNEPKVLLKKIPNSTLWVSDPVPIPTNFEIEYKYCLFRAQKKYIVAGDLVYDLDCFEGDGKSNRKMIFRKNHYDIWQYTSEYKISYANLRHDYLFVEYIYHDIESLDCLKDRIMEYQQIYKEHRDQTVRATNIGFIAEKLRNSISKEQRIFLCILLGYYLLQGDKKMINGIYLPENFPSNIILEKLEEIEPDLILSDTRHLVVSAIRTLVQHNSKYGFTTWFKVFAFARELDATFSFVDMIEWYNYKSKSDEFVKLLKEDVKPYMKEAFIRITNKLIWLSYDLKCLIFVWTNVIEIENTDRFILKALKDKINEFIKFSQPPELRKQFDEFSMDIQSEVVLIFQEKVLQFLNKKGLSWNNPSITSILDLIQNPKLQWSEKTYTQALEAIAESNQMELLDIFPRVLNFVSELDIAITSQTIFTTSIKWFKQNCSINSINNSKVHYGNNQGKVAYTIFHSLSVIYPLIAKRPKIWDKLTSQASDIVASLSDDVLFSVSIFADDFDQEVISYLGMLMKIRINSSIHEIDNHIFKKIMRFSDRDLDLNLPNKFCEEIMCHIFNRLQQQTDKKYNDEVAHQLSFLEFSKFWTLIFKATGFTQSLHSHSYIKAARDTATQLAKLIHENSITLGLLQEMLEHPNHILKNYINSAVKHIENLNITDEILETLRANYKDYDLTFTRLDEFYTIFCSSSTIRDVKSYDDDLQIRRNDVNTVTLEELDSQDYWSIHTATIAIMKSSYYLIRSQTFKNLFQKILKMDERELVLEIVIKEIIPKTIEQYNLICKRYETWEDINFSDANELWQGIDKNQIHDEIKFIASNCKRITKANEKQRLANAVNLLSDVSLWMERLNKLNEVINNLKIPCNSTHWATKYLSHLENEKLTLGQLHKIFEDLNNTCVKKLKLTDDCWSIIKEMAYAKDFVVFLKTLVGYDLKNLINGVDDHSDERLIQEDTVSTFIQLKQIIEPLLKESNDSDTLAVDKFLRNLLNISLKNPSLASKLRLCYANAQALKNMYDNISNRGEVTKVKIYHAVTKGEYLFMKTNSDEYKCTATLSYSSNNSKENVEYTFADLQDLRGRALLIAKTPVNSKASKDNEIITNEITSDHMNEFVIQVDLAQQIINISSQLIELGHFTYRNFKASTNSTIQMEDFLQELLKDYQLWEEIFSKAQEKHYYLIFYPARHIMTFYDYFSNNGEDDVAKFNIKEQCSMLLRFVNDKAELPDIDDDFDIPCEPDNYFDILCAIGAKLYNIFEKVPTRKRLMTVPVEQNLEDTVYSGLLYIATCNDKFRVPNIIMSLYNMHNKCYPEAWQLLICKSSTTAEELLIFIKRCFFAEKNGYGEHLFCIANVESLDFELQYQLVTNIRSLCQQEKQFHLALICCREKGMHHHILDQFSEYVHVTKGLGADLMRDIYIKLCPNVVTVSSDLSGQGKTEWIKDQCFERGLVPRNFLISDGATFENLARKLSVIKLKKTECLHLNIMLIDHPYEINMLLFELLSFGCVNDINFTYIPSTFIFIEITSTTDQYLLNSLPITGYLTKKHLTWNIDNLIVSHIENSSIQIVAKYLDEYDRGMINKVDISFMKQNKQLLPYKRCQQLLQKHFFENNTKDITSYRFLEIFVSVLADQLVRMSSSTFFRVEMLKEMVEDKNIRKTLLETLLKVSMDFATRSVNSKTEQLKNKNLFEGKNVTMGNIKHWEDSNHLLVFFLSQTPDSICALYRNKAMVPENVKDLLKSQHVPVSKTNANIPFELDDFDKMSSEDILIKLECLARVTLEKRNYSMYALSTDNLLKMALILLRSRANIPVVCCGEAGCGKTSLIQFLSMVVEVEFRALNLHAGVSEQEILAFMQSAEEIAQHREVWLFFDEINTCNHIGLLADLIAHRILLGNEIHQNIRLFAACNPYRLRQKSDTQAGLLAKRYEEQSRLAYQVHPLPDQILDYVWDYGVLKASDEKIYIDIMVKKFLQDLGTELFAELLVASQEFTRNNEGVHSVSLRDVKRAIILVKFFNKSFKNPHRKYLFGWGVQDDITRSYILALSLCYQIRSFDREIRAQYCEKMCEIFNKFRGNKFKAINPDIFKEIIRKEQEDYIKRMTKPPQTAENDALLENVLVMIVCILTRIPVFIIGAPGASKSLAIRLVSQNLRGSDSDDPYFRGLPQVYVIPHQGSSSSTSDGIVKVFDKANNYQKGNSAEFPLITVVLLDEIGLAETSPYNPLKVLHSLLEPSYPAELPNVSVIGISNWRLDNSKSSRALIVQRPKFEQSDLIDTAKRLLEKNKLKIWNRIEKLQSLANSYLEYEKNQPIPNFHGLRDYYSFIKSLNNGELKSELTQMSFARNFGGTDQLNMLCQVHFNDVITKFHGRTNHFKKFSVEELIKANLEDKNARHLMIIGKSDSIVNILTYKLRLWSKEFSEKNPKSDQINTWDLDPVIIYGSQFPDDFDGDYQYGILNRIMMCIEAGRPLILTDLEVIYGSLYDLWNQNYITVGREGDQKYYTRIALGAYSNPMVCVHENFRCILVLDEKNVDFADPPLLNRFEKQKMAINDILDDDMKRMVEDLANWTKNISTCVNEDMSVLDFNEHDIFVGFDREETLQSLVILNSNNLQLKDDNDILDKCKEQLLGIALSDGIVRSKKSMLASTNPTEVDRWYNFYFYQQYNHDISTYIRSILDVHQVTEEKQGFKVIINTFSNINADINSYLKDIITCQIDKISTFKSEAQLQSRIKYFWQESEAELLILQCDLTTINAGCIKLAKFLIEQHNNETILQEQTKHVCIILHMRRENDKTTISSFNFMCGWDLITIENLTKQEYPLSTYLDGNLIEILNITNAFDEMINQDLLWCLLCMKFQSSDESANYIKFLAQKIPDHVKFLDCLKIRTFDWCKDNIPENWQLAVAIDKTYLYLYSSFSIALQTYVRNQTRKPIAQLLCELEKLSGLSAIICRDDDMNLFEFWKKIFMDTKIVDIEFMAEPKPDVYFVPNKRCGLKFPFSTYFMDQINKFKRLYQQDLEILEEDEENFDEETEELKAIIVNDCIERFSNNIMNVFPLLKTPYFYNAADLYFKDFVSIISPLSNNDENNELLSWIICHHMKQRVPNPIRLHVHWWYNADFILAELQLTLLFPDIKEKVLGTEFDESLELNFEEFLLEQVSEMKMEDLCNVNIEDDINHTQNHLQLWQRNVTNFLSLSNKLSSSFDNPTLLKLRVYNDLSKSLPFMKLLEIRKFESELGNEDMFSEQFIEIVFEKLDELEQTEQNLSTRRSFVYRCLGVLRRDSPVRLHFYMKIFSQDPLPLTFVTIYNIFYIESFEKDDIFLNLIDVPLEVLKDSKQLQTIENELSKHTDSSMEALCCDVIQTKFFMTCEFNRLAQYYLKATEILITNDVKALQLISAIALLKTFANKLWNSTVISLTDPIEFKFEADEFSIDYLKNRLTLDQPLIHSFKVYLLKSLRLKGLSINEIKQFCETQQQQLPWLGILKWDGHDSRLDFNPYWCLDHYKQAELASNYINNIGDKSYLNKILHEISDPNVNNVVAKKVSFAGMIITKFYLIQASREFNQLESHLSHQIIECLNSSQLPAIYKNSLLNFLSNKYQFRKITANDDSTKLLISSVIAHVVALHISIPANASPLAAYMQNLQNYKNTFILTCPSDEQSVLLNLLIAETLQDPTYSYKGLTRYACSCGYIYVVVDCGKVAHRTGEPLVVNCPNCKKVVGAVDGVYGKAAEGTIRLDEKPLTQAVNDQDEQGYIIETRKTEDYYSVRSMSPAAYRILHLFVHAIIGIKAPSDIVTDFINKKNVNVIGDIINYCERHINNDWEALKNILACKDEHLSLIIHSILSEMSQDPLQIVEKFTTPIQREAWEAQFSQRYVSPRIKNAIGTATDFRKAMAANIPKIEHEINEIVVINDKYCKDYLPRLWRLIGETSMKSFKAYYSCNNEYAKSFPFINVFLKHEKYLSLIKHMLPIVKFTQILSSCLSYRIERQDARKLTFQKFIINESEGDDTGETMRSLNEAFDSFAESWNTLAPHIKRYGCTELPKAMPKINDNSSITYGLLEPLNESIFICAIIDFVAKLQNNFLKDTLVIPPGTCKSLKFLEHTNFKSNEQNQTEIGYHMQSISLENYSEKHIVQYDFENFSNENFKYSQFDLRIGYGQEIQYDLHKIEAELGLALVYEKKFIEANKQGLYLDTFIYHKEMFNESMTILRDIKDLVTQEPIPDDKKTIFTGSSGINSFNDNVEGTLTLENPNELLSTLEMILCFLKYTSGGDCNMLITEYITQWMKLSVLKENNSSYKLLLKAGLQLKHVVALYELIEEQVADVVINYIPIKYQAELSDLIQQDIIESIDLDQEQQTSKAATATKIPAKAFMIALKRFVIRYLSNNTGELFAEKSPLSTFLVDNDSLECWPDNVSKEIIIDKFPKSLYISHAFATYQLIKKEIEKIQAAKQEAQNKKIKANQPTKKTKKRLNLNKT